MKVHGPYRNPVIILFTDGEDSGLLGARAFVLHHPWAKKVGVVISLDVGGVSGQSFMFRTGHDNAWLIEAYAASARQPVANSLSQEVVNRIGNMSTTDLQEFLQADIPGLDFAIFEHRAYYHSMQDTLANLDLGSLQHQGENALNTARYLASIDITNPPPGNAVYMDLLGFTLLRWPAGWTVPLAALVTLTLLGTAVWSIVKKQLGISAVLWGMFAGLSSIVLPILFGEVFTWVMKWISGAPQPGYGYPLPTRLGLWVLALLCAGLVAMAFTRRAGTWGLGLGTWLVWALLGLGMSIFLPGVSILFLTPALLASVVILIASFAPLRISLRACQVAFLVAAAGACLVWFTYAIRFETFFSFDLSPAITFPLGLAFSSLLPVLAWPGQPRLLNRYWIPAAAVIVVLLAGIGILLPDYSETNPIRLPIIHLEDQDSKTAIWGAAAQSLFHESQTGSVPDPLQRHFTQIKQVFPWSNAMMLSASADVTGRSGAEVGVLSDEINEGNRIVRMQVHVPQDAYRVELQVPIQNLNAVEVGGETLPAIPELRIPAIIEWIFTGMAAMEWK